MIDKARDLIAPVLGREISGRLIETIFKIENTPDIRSLRPMLQPTGATHARPPQQQQGRRRGRGASPYGY